MTRTHDSPVRTRTPAWLAIALAVGLALAVLVPTTSLADDNGDTTGGPVILMGLDSELAPGSPGHGPPHEHAAMVQALLDDVTNDGEGILVIGPESGNVEQYWKEDIGDALDVDIDFASGVSEIESVSFDGYAAIAVASSEDQMGWANDGLTNDENEALIARDVEVAEFVNQGGGLIGKTQDGMDNPFGYVGPLGEFDVLDGIDGIGYEDIEVTDAGKDLGLTQDGMSGWCCWHDVFLEFPDFMEVLVYNTESGSAGEGEAAAIGGVDVTIPTGIDLEPLDATLEIGEEHELTAIVEQDDEPADGVEVTFTVTDGPHDGELGTAETDEDGLATISYEGENVGTDTVVATFVDRLERERTSNEVTVEWIPEPGSLSLAPDEESLEIGELYTATATLVDDEGEPVEDVEVTFTVTDGPHEGVTNTVDTDGDGTATLSFEGIDVGTDTVVATHTTDEDQELASNEVTVEWAEVLDEVEEVEEAEPAEPVEEEPDYTG